MTFYDDAELAAIAVVREALTEFGEPSGARARSLQMRGHLMAIYEQHGDPGVTGIVLALGRFANVLLQVHADNTGRDALQVLDEFEMHTIEQHSAEAEEGGEGPV